MIAIVGCVKESVRVKLEPQKEPDHQEFGAGYGAAYGGYGMAGMPGGYDMPGMPAGYGMPGMPAGYGAPENYGMTGIPGMQEMPDGPEEDAQAPAAAEAEENDDDIAVKSSGCGYSIAVRLASWGHEVEMISAIGDDDMGAAAKAGMEAAGIGCSGVASFADATAVDVDLVNIFGEAAMSYQNRRVIRNITPEFLRERKDILDRAEAIVVDGMIPREAIAYIAEEYGGRDDKKVFFDPAELDGGNKAKDLLYGFHCIMPGRMEAEAMSGKSVLSKDELLAAGRFFTEAGAEKVIITIKGGGLYYREGDSEGILRPEKVLSLYNTSGAGDAVSASVVSGAVNGKAIDEIAADAMAEAASYLADIEAKVAGR